MKKLTPEELAAWTQFAAADLASGVYCKNSVGITLIDDIAADCADTADIMLVEWRKRRDGV